MMTSEKGRPSWGTGICLCIFTLSFLLLIPCPAAAKKVPQKKHAVSSKTAALGKPSPSSKKKVSSKKSAPPLFYRELNEIAQAGTVLGPFYDRLKLLEKGELDRVTILHIGDSHIQSGDLTAELREPLQAAFGNGGRGLIFPYGVARTNGPNDYRVTSNTSWSSLRSVRADASVSMGVTGYTIRTDNENGRLDITLKNCPTPAEQGFDSLIVLHDKGPGEYELSVRDDGAGIEARKEPLAERGEETASKFLFSRAGCTGSIQNVKTGEEQASTRIHGMVLLRGDRGILYHTAGVNGAVFDHFTRSSLFSRHLELLRPDLVIVSLGTNSAFGGGFDATEVDNQLDRLFESIRRASPDSMVLFTTPPDAGNGRNKGVKQRVARVRQIIAEFSTVRRAGCWDLYRIMGGAGSMGRWQKHMLAQKDAVHFTRQGYELQGRLLLDAIMKGYRAHGSH